MSDQKRRSAGTRAPKATVRANEKHLSAKAGVEGSHPVSIEGLRSLSGYLIRQAQLFVFHDFNQRLAPLDLPSARYSVLRPARKSGIVADALSVVPGIGRFKIVPVLDGAEDRPTRSRAVVEDRGGVRQAGIASPI